MNHKPEQESGKQPQESREPQTLPSVPAAESPVEQAQTTAPAPEADAQILQIELEAAKAVAAENLDKFLRAKAETENVRRRAETEVSNSRKYAIERFAGEILAVRDSLELARSVDVQQDNREALARMHEGLDLTLKLLDDIFEKFSLRVIDPVGEKFDPQQHQAMGMEETEEVPPNHIVKVVQKGFTLHDRLLRPAMVIVARPHGEGSPGEKP